MPKNWNELKHVLVHVIVHLIYFKRDWLKRNFGQPLHLHYFVLKFRCFTTVSPTEIWISGFFRCAVSMSSSTRCDAVSVSSQMDTYFAKVQAGVTLSINAFEFWHARGRSRLVKDLTCAAASQAYVECILSVCGLLYSGWRRAMFRCLEMSICIKLRQCWKKRLAHGNRLSETWC